MLGVPVLGGVNIDDSCVIINKSPHNGAATGCVSFLQEDIDLFVNRFGEVSEQALSEESFREKLRSA